MTLRKTLGTALRALRRNLTRAVLTTLGVIIGIAAVITMMEIGQASADAVNATIESMGANSLQIFPGSASTGGISYGAGSTLTLTAQDCEEIISGACPAVAYAAPIVQTRTQIVYRDRNYPPNAIYGTTPEYLDVRSWDLTEGENFTDQEVRNSARVCLLGQKIVKEVFDGASPVGKEIRINNISFTVKGVLKAKGANTFGQDQDDIVLAPWTAIKYRVSSGGGGGGTNFSSSGSQKSGGSTMYPGSDGQPIYPPASANAGVNIPVRFVNINQIAVSAKNTEEAIPQITDVLRRRHRLRDGQPDDFQIRDTTELARSRAETTNLMTRLLLCVATISLVVGGVGIMNIMLVSVTERTREIGLRMAVGARGMDVLQQFLIEAVVLCTAGGIMGILLGRLSSILISALLGWNVQPSVSAATISFCVSVAIGVIFGFYPAWKASRLDPIEALRYE